jgi:hypothetical protein
MLHIFYILSSVQLVILSVTFRYFFVHHILILGGIVEWFGEQILNLT